jgi:anti-sigma regulatory factor (Ser/Thr protein kinase)
MCYQDETSLVQSDLAPSNARRIVRRRCKELHVPDVTDTAVLLTSELVTNAVRYAPGPLQLGVSCTEGCLVVSVQDANPEPPRPRRAQARELGGRGLALVGALADHWGVRQMPNDGKAVWFALRPRATPQPQSVCTCATEPVGADVLAEMRTGPGAAPAIPFSRKPQAS